MQIFIQIVVDPHADIRGFSIKGRKMRLKIPYPVDTEMEGIDGKKMFGKFWVIEHDEFIRVIPEFRLTKKQDWVIPVEFAEPIL